MIKKSILVALGISFAVSLTIITVSNKITEDFERQQYRTGKTINELERKMMYIISDKDFNGKVDESEIYQLGLELKVVKEDEKISEKELTKRIKDAPISEVENYINKYIKKD
jgi:hypothetical protein